VAYLAYCRLTLIDHGRPIALPAGIGVLSRPAISGGRCSYGLWTRASSAVVRVQSSSTRVYTLGQFCDIWSRTADVDAGSVDATFVRELRATPATAIHVYVGGRDVGSDNRHVALAGGASITVEIGAPLVTPIARFEGPDGATI